MRPLIITYVHNVVRRCCEGNATSVECLSCDNEWRVDDVCVPSGWQSCEECDLCPVQDNEVVVDWSSALMWGTIKKSNSQLLALLNSHARRESVDQ